MGSRYRGLRVLVAARHLCTTRQAKRQDYREAELFLRGALNTKQERDHKQAQSSSAEMRTGR